MAFFLLVMFSRHFLASIVVKRFPVLNSFFFTILDLVEKWSLWPSTLNGRNFRFQQQKTNKVKYLPVTTHQKMWKTHHLRIIVLWFPMVSPLGFLTFALVSPRHWERGGHARGSGVRAPRLGWELRHWRGGPLARHLGMGNLAIFVGVLWEITGNSRGKRREIRCEDSWEHGVY